MTRLKYSFIKWLVVVSLCLLLGFLLGKLRLDILQNSLDIMEANLQQSRAEKIQLFKDMTHLDTLMMSDRQSINLLTQDNKNLNNQINELSQKLYFYERVVAPELHEYGVQVYSFTVDQNAETQQWNYELTLMQAPKGRRLLTGNFALNFSVVKDLQLQNISINELTDTPETTFKFKYFQTIKGSFTLPTAIQVEDVILTLNVAGNRWYKTQQIEQRYPWQSLIEKEDDNLMGTDVDKF